MPARSTQSRRPAPNLLLSERHVWATNEVMAFLHWSRSRLNRAIWCGLLRPTRDGRSLRFAPDEVRNLAQRIRTTGLPSLPELKADCEAMAAANSTTRA